MMMDASMYEHCSASDNSSPMMVEERRRRMSLDFTSPQRKCFDSQVQPSNVASPDLEAFLLYASAGSTDVDWTDNTPTQILCPKSVTAEQEAYARGFVDALEELHRRQGAPAATDAGAPHRGTWTQPPPSSSYCVETGTVPGWTCERKPAVPLRAPVSSVSSPAPSSALGDATGVVQRCRPTDDGLQTVPRLSCLTPPSSPDVDVVELARVDRKRERNRLAAQKCRSRKLEQIVVLESRCAVLRAENDALSRSASQLADDVTSLRRQLAAHSTSPDCVISKTCSPTSN